MFNHVEVNYLVANGIYRNRLCTLSSCLINKLPDSKGDNQLQGGQKKK